MLKKDFLLDLAESLGKNIANSITNAKNDSDRISIESLSDKDMIFIILKKMISEKKYNEAENILFEFIEKNKNDLISETVEWFYKELSSKSDKDLLENNFSREEIELGLNDFKKITNLPTNK